jgi:NhaP-type Na+/H+ or K+/H+ antiporter
VTAFSCFAIGIAFLIALLLLVLAGVLIGGVIPWLLERARRAPKPPDAGRE